MQNDSMMRDGRGDARRDGGRDVRGRAGGQRRRQPTSRSLQQQRQRRRQRESVPQFESDARGRRQGSRHDTGYRVSRRQIRFNDRSGRGFLGRLEPAQLVMMAIGIIILFLLIFGISSCVRGCTAQKASEAEKQTNPVDSRVAYGASEDITNALASRLDEDEDLSWIAKHADEYSDDRIIQLALRESAAVSFVRGLPDAKATSAAYEDAVTQGTCPVLYDWDTRWGYVEYGGDGLPLGLTGSGPTCLSIVYMGITGNSDKTPADMAQLATDSGCATGDLFCTGDLFSGQASGLGLSCVQTGVTSDELLSALQTGFVIAQANAGTLTSDAHWVVVTTANDDGSVSMIDPTSTEVTSHEWDPGTIASSCAAFYCLSAA
ncbi:MAG: hypothetical protein LKG38_03385 [Atopobiaceae bacterium]|jgi:hypothetical protein|nr:hypothetical protein [Atopobiaceae bacterium]MCH4120313.1 hypothetical protein [Atopobiaceae bacterium]MCI1318369.1 hypothetical protein [Atopobiaceae bacterium]MCI1389268.1 hypothetical protein [Atopobiaceae bacterium]MCI1432331.1 hypothetical protein [Atopobiaceae bacterium]